jgi:predicted nuclease of predicted toxin-antitoxin system
MALDLYADECVDYRIVTGLRRRQISVVTAQDENLLSAPDERHFERAMELGRAVVTEDHDFLAMVSARVEKSAKSPGLIFILPGTSVGDAVRSIHLIATVFDAQEIASKIEWVP